MSIWVKDQRRSRGIDRDRKDVAVEVDVDSRGRRVQDSGVEF